MFPIRSMSAVLMEYDWNVFCRDGRTVLCTIDGSSTVWASYLPEVHYHCRDISNMRANIVTLVLQLHFSHWGHRVSPMTRKTVDLRLCWQVALLTLAAEVSILPSSVNMSLLGQTAWNHCCLAWVSMMILFWQCLWIWSRLTVSTEGLHLPSDLSHLSLTHSHPLAYVSLSTPRWPATATACLTAPYSLH